MRPMLDRFFHRVAIVMALAGGIVLCAVIVMVGLSVFGRASSDLAHGLRDSLPFAQALIDLGLGAIRGDFELVEAALGFVIFAFMPLASLQRAHARVDLLTPYLPRSVKRGSDHLSACGFAIAFTVMAAMLSVGTWSKYQSGQTSFILAIPVWMPQAAAVGAAWVAAIVALYVAMRQFGQGSQDE